MLSEMTASAVNDQVDDNAPVPDMVNDSVGFEENPAIPVNPQISQLEWN